MGSRLKLHEELCAALGSRRVYYQPPSSCKLVYPCIVYSDARNEEIRADNQLFAIRHRYDLTLMELEADSALKDKLTMAFPMCSHERSYRFDELYHNTFTLFYD